MPWKETQEEIEARRKRNNAKIKKHEECYNFAEIGDKIKYLGVEVTLVGYDKPEIFGRFGVRYKPGLNVEWFNTRNEIQRAFINHIELQLCEKKEAV